METYNTGIVMLNYNTYDDVVKCVESIRKYVKSSYGIYLVDNHSRKECVEKLQFKFARDNDIILLCLKENLGYSGGNNIGIKKAVADGVENILIINPDVEVLNDIVSIMASELKNSVVCVGPKIFDIDGKDGQRLRKNYCFRYALFNKKPFYYLRKIMKGDNKYKYDVDTRFEFVGSSSGCCFMIKASFFQDINFFDENVFLYSEEYILGKKLEKLKKKCCYLPSAMVIHKEGASTQKISNPFVDYHMYTSEYYLLANYCKLNKIQLSFIKMLRITNFFMKFVLHKGYWNRLKMLIYKLKEIDKGNYKIVF